VDRKWKAAGYKSFRLPITTGLPGQVSSYPATFVTATGFSQFGIRARTVFFKAPSLVLCLHFIPAAAASSDREEMMSDLKRSCLLLILGLALPLTLGCGSSLRRVPEPQAASFPEPKIWRERVGAIPSVDARVTKLVFFASGPADIAPLKEPVYRTRFHHSMTKTVYPEIYLDYPAPGKKVFFTVTAHFREKGKTIRIVDYESRIEPSWTMSHHSVGAGILGTGNWPVGNYDVDIHINGEKVATGYFEVY